MILSFIPLITLLIITQNLAHAKNYKCLYEDTINITDSYILTNGSYMYRNHTLIQPDLVDIYDYEILYNRTKQSVPTHKRACICHLKTCISFCSENILYHYQEIMANNPDLLIIFEIDIKMSNNSIVSKNIVEDFEHTILKGFCPDHYALSTETGDDYYAWTLFEVSVI